MFCCVAAKSRPEFIVLGNIIVSLTHLNTIPMGFSAVPADTSQTPVDT